MEIVSGYGISIYVDPNHSRMFKQHQIAKPGHNGNR